MLAKILPIKVEKKQIFKIICSSIEQIDKEDNLIFKGHKVDKNLFKRICDIVITSFTFIFILSWLFPLLAVVIKISSKGPVFFSQKREGVNRKVFSCIKFRTMIANSKDIDDDGKYVQATYKDIRITKVGSFLRRTSLDELPQFINVLKGEMSIVGPRPHPIPLNRESEKNIAGYNLRHLVKPGITGLAQVNGFRGETKQIGSMKKRVENDLIYIRNWNWIIDFKIIVMTVKNIIIGEDHVY